MFVPFSRGEREVGLSYTHLDVNQVAPEKRQAPKRKGWLYIYMSVDAGFKFLFHSHPIVII